MRTVFLVAVLFAVALGGVCAQSGYVSGVPDANQPPGNPMNKVGFDTSNYCGPMAAVNVTEYWDAQGASGPADDVNGNPNLGVANTAQYLGWWMNTNADPIMAGCPYRQNGDGIVKKGTLLIDIAAGLTQFARWDNNNSFGCTPPPNLLAGKNGYSWTVSTSQNLATAWAGITGEINASRPLIVVWNFWNPTNAYYNSEDGYTYYDWGDHTTSSSVPVEEWNSSQELGHATTGVGYKTNYSPPGSGKAATNWVIVHDNWSTTATDVAIPFAHNDGQTPVWMANITVNPNNVPGVATVAVAVGPNDPGNHSGCIGANVLVGEINFAAGANNGVLINALTLVAAGTGNDANDLTSITLAKGNTTVTYMGGYPADNGTLTLAVPGDWRFKAAAGQNINIQVLYQLKGATPIGNSYSFQLSNAYATDTSSYLPATVNGLPYNSGIMCSQLCLVAGEARLYDEWWLRRLRTLGGDGDYFMLQAPSPVKPTVTLAGTSFGRTAYLQDPQEGGGGGGGGMALDYSGSASLGIGRQISEMKVVLTTINGEKTLYVRDSDAPYFTLGPMGPPLPPVAMTAGVVGGTDLFYDPVTLAGQKGVVGGVGLNNIGMLVRAFGTVTPDTSASFYIADGSGALLKVRIPPAVPLPIPDSYVSVTGVCSTEMAGSDLRPVIKIRESGDVVTLRL